MNFQVNKASLIGGVLALLLVVGMASKGIQGASLLQRTVVREDSRLPKGTVAPDFQLPGPNGETLGLGNLRGAMSLLVFVTPTCPYCKQLKEGLLSQGVPDLKKQIVFITPKADHAHALSAEVQELETKIGSLFPVLQDTAGEIANAYKAHGVPTSYLLDKEGKVVDSGVGAPEGLKLAQKLISESLVSQSSGCATCQ